MIQYITNIFNFVPGDNDNKRRKIDITTILSDSEIEFSENTSISEESEEEIQPKYNMRTRQQLYKCVTLPISGQSRQSVVRELNTRLNTVCAKDTYFIKLIRTDCLNESRPFLNNLQYLDTQPIMKIKSKCDICDRQRLLSHRITVMINNKTYILNVGDDCFKQMENILRCIYYAHKYFVQGSLADGIQLESLLRQGIEKSQNVCNKYGVRSKEENEDSDCEDI